MESDIIGIPLVNYHERYLKLPTITRKKYEKGFSNRLRTGYRIKIKAWKKSFYGWKKGYTKIDDTSYPHLYYELFQILVSHSNKIQSLMEKFG